MLAFSIRPRVSWEWSPSRLVMLFARASRVGAEARGAPAGRRCRAAPRGRLAARLIAVALGLSLGAPPPIRPAPAWAAGVLSEQYFVSSVDGTSQVYLEYLPDGWDSAATYPLRTDLHGRGGSMYAHADGEMLAAADAAGYIVAFINGRVPWSYYVDSDSFGPGEQDIFDMVEDVRARRLVDPNRVYLSGGSMGGFGSWSVALRNPGYFAAIAPAMGWTDCFHQWLDTDQHIAENNLATAIGGPPGESPAIDALWLEYSSRFLLENAIHTPVSVWHGDLDSAVSNNLAFWPYMQSHHVTDTPGFTDPHGTWPTLQELAADALPGEYVEEHHWIPGVGHSWRLVTDQDSIFAFFDRHVRDPNPRRVAIASYDSTHVAYAWLRQVPWAAMTTKIASTRAERRPESNSVVVSFDGPHAARFDLEAMGLDPTGALVCSTSAYRGYAGNAAVELAADWATVGAVAVTFDGVVLVEGEGYARSDSLIALAPFPAASPHGIVVVPALVGVAPLADRVPGEGARAASDPRILLFPAGANPARGETPSVWLVSLAAPAEGAIIDLEGRRIRDLGRVLGSGLLSWDGRDDSRRRVRSGIYFLSVRIGGEARTARCVRLW